MDSDQAPTAAVGDRVTLQGRITEIRDGEAYVEVEGSTGCHDGNVWVRLGELGHASR